MQDYLAIRPVIHVDQARGSRSWSTAIWRFSDMAASYLEASLDRLGAPRAAGRHDRDLHQPRRAGLGRVPGRSFHARLGTPLTPDRIKDLGNQIASAASTTLSTKKPIVSVSILYRDRPIRAQVIQPPPSRVGSPSRCGSFPPCRWRQSGSGSSMARSAASKACGANGTPRCAMWWPPATSTPPCGSASRTSST